MDRYVNSQLLKRYRNLLETSVDETERQTIQRMLTEAEASQALDASAPEKQ
jgi:hypothetical protein